MDLLGQEVSPDGRLVLVRELLANVLVHQGGLADAAGGRANKRQTKKGSSEEQKVVVVELEEEEERRDETRASDRKPFAGWPADRPRSSRGRREGSAGGEGGADPPCGPSRPPNAREEEGFCLRGTHPLSPRMITFNKVRLRGAAILCLSLCVRLSLSLSLSLCLRLSKRFAGFACCLSFRESGCGGCRNPKFQKIGKFRGTHGFEQLATQIVFYIPSIHYYCFFCS